jgi:poly-gamma-glutamate capsule biosynthesis protein CapA/YwtB (metallophosphatase superfamily)
MALIAERERSNAAMPTSETTIGLIGNVYLAQRVSQLTAPRFLAVADVLRGCDVTVANLECAIPNSDDPPAFVAGTGWAGTYMAGRPEMIEDLRFLGVDAVGVANNHVGDFGEQGVLSTIDNLRHAGMPYAGIGATLREASQPMYLDTAAGLRVAFISVCDWGPRGALGLGFPWPTGYMPSDELPPFRSRPGVNLLRYEAVSFVSAEQLEQLRRMSTDLGWDREKVFRSHGFWRSHPLVGMITNLDVEVDADDVVYFLGRRFVAREEVGSETVACDEDLDRILTQVSEARRQADIVCVGLHDQSHGEDVHGYVSTLAHGAIDAGADVFFNNGGWLMGIELYKGKAIIHGVPSFYLQTEAVTHIPASAMARYRLPPYSTAADFLDTRERAKQVAFEAVGSGPAPVAVNGPAAFVCTFDDHARLAEIAIQPFEPLGGTVLRSDDDGATSRHRRGLPLMPAGDRGLPRRIVEHVAHLSQEFDTRVDLRAGIGIVTVPRAET